HLGGHRTDRAAQRPVRRAGSARVGRGPGAAAQGGRGCAGAGRGEARVADHRRQRRRPGAVRQRGVGARGRFHCFQQGTVTVAMLRISDDRNELDVDLVLGFLSREAYWSRGIPWETVERAIAGSLCFGGYLEGEGQVAFARVITDGATFGYLADVFVLPAHRGRGYGRQLVAAVLAHPQLQGLRRFMLATSDAHGLYAQFGFTEPARPQTLMEILRPGIYQSAAVTA